MVEIPLRRHDGSVRATAFVDADVAERVGVHRWSLHSRGYAQRRAGGHTILLHREVMGLRPGDPGRVDHINRDKLDCRRSNLRPATHAENMQNTAGNAGTSSRYRGVTWRADMRKWQAQGKANGRYRYLGLFEHEEDAAAASAAFRARHMPFSEEALAC